MKFNPDIHHRRSNRLLGYDYSRAGAYFLTICAQNRECVFGRVSDGVVQPSAAGEMVERWWAEISKKFPSAETDEFVVMPNHVHGILFLDAGVVRPHRGGRPHRAAPTGETIPAAPALGEIAGWFKTMTTNEYIRCVKDDEWPPFHGKLWQRNYYDRIIRDEDELNQIRKYIAENPLKWVEDENHPDRAP